MRCREARACIAIQRDSDLTASDRAALQEHLQECNACRAFERRQSSLDMLLCSTARGVRAGISTDNIMLAIQQRSRITRQIEDIRAQQRSRMEQMRFYATVLAAFIFFTVGSLPLLLLAITIIQTDLVIKALAPLNGVLDMLFILAQYLQEGVTMVTRNNLLLSGLAFAVVVMMGMWLHLMRHPQDA